ncbi:MAG: AMP-binding protein [Bacteriovoracaceae bacterium]|nr:AMP-binding protein [Bacteriovoracaceae bacterium]
MNIANRLTSIAKKTPHKQAISFPQKSKFTLKYQYLHLTFEQLEAKSNHYAQKFSSLGMKKGHKTLLFIRPCLDFTAIVFALFKLGVIPVLIDPGMGRKNLLNAISQVEPDILIAEPIVHIIKSFFKEQFKSIKIFVSTCKLPLTNTHSLKALIAGFKTGESQHICHEVEEGDVAAILFTSGGTGVPKGVVYTHKIFNAQIDILQELFSLNDSEIDLPGFPLFSLFTVTMGMKSCIPDMNPAKPANVKPQRIVQNIIDQSCTFIAGSPAIWKVVGNYCKQNQVTLPSVKYLVMFGAPVATDLHQIFETILPNGTTYTPYGATESLPVSNISGEYILQNTKEDTEQGKGTCIGVPVPTIEALIIRVSDKQIDCFDDIDKLSVGEVGEIIVSGNVVTPEYFKMPEKTKLAKIYEQTENGIVIWHRMGDLGYFDESGKLWFCGRATHRVQTDTAMLCSVQCEAIFNQHPKVARSALIGISTDKVGVVIEMIDHKMPHGDEKAQLEKELSILASKYTHTQDIKHYFYHKNFPVDIRHNIKIDRLMLRKLFDKV